LRGRHRLAVACAVALVGLFGAAAPSDAAPPKESLCGESELAPFLGAGTANLEGQIVSPKPARGAAAGSRIPIELFPATPCVERWWSQPSSHVLKRGLPFGTYPEDRRFAEARRLVYSDEAGTFAIYGMPAGRYFLRIPWLEERPTAYSVEITGTYMLEVVVLEPGKTTKLTLRGPKATQ
jgi:hypothetical protein